MPLPDLAPLVSRAPLNSNEKPSLFSWETLKSKTFWGAVIYGVLETLQSQGVAVPELLIGLVVAFTGISLADSQTKVKAKL